MTRGKLTLGLLLLYVCCSLIRCGWSNSNQPPISDPTPTPTPVVVSVMPTTAAVTIGQTIQFSASVSNTSNTAVTWLVNNVGGGNDTVGTISSDGLYTAPGRVPSDPIWVSATSVADQTKSATMPVTLQGYAGMLSYHNDAGITGQNLSETVLTPENVNQNSFGKLRSYPLDDQSYAQPLYVANVPFPGAGTHNAVYVATESNSVYAFDADGVASSPFWQKNLMPPGATPVDGTKTGHTGGPILPRVGITSTPVIDGASGTLYVVAVTQESSGHVHRLHALDITTGEEKFGGPAVIQASVPGTGAGSVNGQISFNAQYELQRSALSLVNGVVYIAWASYDDAGPYHGWIMGYDASTLNQVIAWNTTPNGEQGGIWLAGASLSSDAQGYIYAVTGNGTFDADRGGTDYGDTFLKLKPSGNTFTVSDYFTPYDQQFLADNDIDVGSSGFTLLPNQPDSAKRMGIGAGKAGKIYLLDLDNLGKFQSGSDSQIVQSIPNAITSQSTLPRAGHVVLVIEENHQFSEVYPNGMPWLVTQARSTGAIATKFSSTIGSFQSLGAYLWLSSGSLEPQFGCTGNGCSQPITDDNIFRELDMRGMTWKVYAQSLPSAGYTGDGPYPYLKGHNPAVWYSSVLDNATDQQRVVPFTQFLQDLNANTLPNYSIVIPDSLHDAHNGTLATADAFLQANIAPLLSSSHFSADGDGVLMVTFDECGEGENASCGSHVFSAMLGPLVNKGLLSNNPYSHSDMLHTIEDLLGIQPYFGAAANALDMADFFTSCPPPGGGSCSLPNVGTRTSNNDFSTATYWQGNVYFIGNGDVIKQFKLSNGLLSTSPVAQGTHVYGFPGANMSISASGANNGIVWSIEALGVNVLHAYDATNVANELYNSSQAPNGRDQFGVAVRFTVPTVMNGRVYVAGATQLSIFGPL